MKQSAFTLAEMLIALMLLGVVAAFTIPKVLTNMSSQRNNTVAKEALAAFTEAYNGMRLRNELVPGVTTTHDIVESHLNATRIVNGLVNDEPSTGNPLNSQDCSNPDIQCYFLGTGAMLWWGEQNGCLYRNRTGINDAMYIHVDPDGRYLNSLESSSITFFVYDRDGALAVPTNLRANTTVTRSWNNTTNTHNTNVNGVPVWFSW